MTPTTKWTEGWRPVLLTSPFLDVCAELARDTHAARAVERATGVRPNYVLDRGGLRRR